MGLIAVLLFYIAMGFTAAVLDYYDYEDMVTHYKLWAYHNPEHK